MDDMSEKISFLERDVSVLKTDVAVLKTDVAALKTDVAVIRSNYVTKEDLAMLEASLLKWGFGGLVALAGIVVTAFKFVR